MDTMTIRYGTDMDTKTQITVRLSKAVVDHIDEMVEAGLTPSRASYLDKLADMERRRRTAIGDLPAIVRAQQDPDDDLAGFTAWLKTRTYGDLGD